MGKESGPVSGPWRILFTYSFILGLVATALVLFFLRDLNQPIYQSYVTIHLATLASCIIGGVAVGLFLPPVPYRLAALQASFSSVVGMTVFFLLFNLINPPFLPHFLNQVTSNLFTSIIGGFIGGCGGSVLKRLITRSIIPRPFRSG